MGKTKVCFVHIGEVLVHGIAARIKPAIDRQTVTLGDRHRFGAVGGVSFLQDIKCRKVDALLFSRVLLLIVCAVVLCALLRFMIGIGFAPALLDFVVINCGVKAREHGFGIHSGSRFSCLG